MKWYIFRFFVAYFHWKVIKTGGYSFLNCWEYADSFDNFFEGVEWKTIISDAKYAVDEDFSCWTE